MGDNGDDNDDTNLTLLDRTIVPILYPNGGLEDESVGSTDIPVRIQRIHLLHGTSLIYDACQLLQLNKSSSIYATACVIFHRFYHTQPTSNKLLKHRLQEYDVWSIAMACLLLSTKIEDDDTDIGDDPSGDGDNTKKGDGNDDANDGGGGGGSTTYTMAAPNVNNKSVSQIVLAFCHLYRKRLLLLLPGSESECQPRNLVKLLLEQNESILGITNKHLLSNYTTMEKENKIISQLPIPSKLGLIYQEWCKQLLEVEQVVLCSLGFTLYWISSDKHPHKFILYFLRVLEISSSKDDNDDSNSNTNTAAIKFAQCCWNYCNDSCRLDLCVRYPSELIVSNRDTIHV